MWINCLFSKIWTFWDLSILVFAKFKFAKKTFKSKRKSHPALHLKQGKSQIKISKRLKMVSKNLYPCYIPRIFHLMKISFLKSNHLFTCSIHKERLFKKFGFCSIPLTSYSKKKSLSTDKPFLGLFDSWEKDIKKNLSLTHFMNLLFDEKSLFWRTLISSFVRYVIEDHLKNCGYYMSKTFFEHIAPLRKISHFPLSK